MNFLPLYRISFYAVLFLATLILCVEAAEDSMVARFLPLAVAVVAALAFLSVDRDPRYGLSLGSATLFSWMAIFLCYLEYRSDETRVIPPLSHWLTYLQMIKMFRSKTNEDEWYLLLIALVQVMVGAILSTGSDVIGPLILIWSLLAVWTLVLFYLNRAAQRGDVLALAMVRSASQSAAKRGVGTTVTRALPAAAVSASRMAGAGGASAASAKPKRKPKPKPKPRSQSRQRYAGLIDHAFVMTALRIALTSLLLGCTVFLLAPRFSSNPTGGAGSAAQSLTGFDGDRMKVGDLGEILESDALVMYVQLADDETGQALSPTDVPYEPLWRGTCMTIYRTFKRDGRLTDSEWVRGDQDHPQLADVLTKIDLEAAKTQSGPQKRIRQTITMEPTRMLTRFAMRPILRLRESHPDLIFLSKSGTLAVQEPGSTLSYTVVSGADPNLAQPRESKINPTLDFRRDPNADELRIDDPSLKARLREIALKVVGTIPEEDYAQRARALETWFRDSGEFGYSLQMMRTDGQLDPIEDFLVNHKQGHCSYYSSALALLLRSLEIPSRVVNGFKGGDWDGVNKVMNVRQKHAHSWTEAYAPSPKGLGWITLDPTPSGERDASVAKVGSLWPSFRQLNDAIRYVWVFYVQGFNADRQRRLVYEPLQRLIRNAREGFTIMGAKLKQIFTFKDVRAVFSLDGFIAAFLALSGLALALRSLFWLWRKLIRRLWPGARRKREGEGLEIEFYQRLIRLLGAQGLDRLATETPLEFGRRAGALLAARIRDDRALMDAPSLVAEAFYRVRFGEQQLSSEALDELDHRLNALESALRAA